MDIYINGAASSNHLTLDIKELIPDANLRRRMSHVVKMGVTTGMECLKKSSTDGVDAIVTAMGLGCLADSEKFLKNIMENEEQMLNPTPFIQSTFNTIGGQIALLTGNHGYNMTYSHRNESFESAFLDSYLLLSEGAANSVLVGSADELTPTLGQIMCRLGVSRKGITPSEGSCFFVLGATPSSSTVARITHFSIGNESIEGDFDKIVVPSNSYFTSTSEALWNGVEAVNNGAKRVLVSNGCYQIALQCL